MAQIDDLSRGPAEAPAQDWLALRLSGLSQDVVVEDCPDLHDGLSRVLRGWPWSTAPLPETNETDAAAPLGRCGVFAEPDSPGRFLVASTYLEEPMRALPLASALCALAADLSQFFVDDAPGTCALHCGAFRVGDGLVAVTGSHRAGKSTLIARLTAETGVEVFCDDVLPITDDGEGIALGIAPRLRLPLPQGVAPGFRQHVAAHLGPHDDRYGYLCAPGLAPHGARAPLRTVIVLDRRDDATLPRLHHLDRGEAFHNLMARNLGHFDSADGAVAALEDLLARLICLRLVYSDLEQAVALLTRVFAAGARPAPAQPLAPALPFDPAPAKQPAAPVDPDTQWQRAGAVAVRRVGATAVLWRPGGAMVWQLNLVARAVWDLLGDDPASVRELADLLSDVFPDAGQPRLMRDLAGLLGGLADADLVSRVA